MEVQFQKNITYRSRVGAPVVISISRRTSCYAIVELENSETDYPVLFKKIIQRSDDGREFIDICIANEKGEPGYARVWATDAQRR